MKRTTKYTVPIIFTLFAILLFYFEEAIFEGIRSGIYLSLDTIIPSIFPFLIFSKLAIDTDAFAPFQKALAPVCRLLFNLPEKAGGIFIISLIGGYPIGALLARDAYSKGELTSEQVRGIMRFCVVGGPGFIIGGIGRQMFKSVDAGIILYLSCVISSLLCGIISGRMLKYQQSKPLFSKSQPLSDVFINSVSSSCNSMVIICSYVVFFSGVISLLGSFDIPHLCYNILVLPLEVTNGSVISSASLGIPATAGVLAFSGIAIHCQILSMLKGQIKISEFIGFRIISSALAFAMAKIITLIHSPAISTFSTVNSQTLKLGNQGVIMSLFLVALSVFMIISSSKEKEKIDFTGRL